MAIAKVHPCNTFGWLHIEGHDADRAFSHQLRLLDAELQRDPQFSGEPPAFRAWSIEHVRSLATEPRIATQLQERVALLQKQLTNLTEQAARAAEQHRTESLRIGEELRLLHDLSGQSELDTDTANPLL